MPEGQHHRHAKQSKAASVKSGKAGPQVAAAAQDRQQHGSEKTYHRNGNPGIGIEVQAFHSNHRRQQLHNQGQGQALAEVTAEGGNKLLMDPYRKIRDV